MSDNLNSTNNVGAYYNINTNQVVMQLPLQVNPNQWNPSWTDYSNAGWRKITNTQPVPADTVVLSYSYSDNGDGNTCSEVIATSDTQEAYNAAQSAAAAAAVLARINATPCAWSMMKTYVAVMERNFGAGSASNKTMTYEQGALYFSELVEAGTITPQQTADAAWLAQYEPQLAALAETGNAYDLPFSQIPAGTQ